MSGPDDLSRRPYDVKKVFMAVSVFAFDTMDEHVVGTAPVTPNPKEKGSVVVRVAERVAVPVIGAKLLSVAVDIF
jgi:hypothetical protein